MDSLRYPSGLEKDRRGGWRDAGRRKENQQRERRAAPAGEQMGVADNKVD